MAGKTGLTRTYLQGTGSLPIDAPIIIHIVANQSQNRNVEQNLPPWHDASKPIQPRTGLHQGRIRQLPSRSRFDRWRDVTRYVS